MVDRIREQRPNEREKHVHQFDVEVSTTAAHITYGGKKFVSVRHLAHLPPGFEDRVTEFFMDLLTGKRTALWDEQAVFGEYRREPAETRRRGELQADHYARLREGGK